MTAKHPFGAGESRLFKAIRRALGMLRQAQHAPGRPGTGDPCPCGIPPGPPPPLDCQQPDAPPDLPLTHGLRLAGIEGRLARLETQMTNQNRLLLIGVIALIGEFAKQLLKP